MVNVSTITNHIIAMQSENPDLRHMKIIMNKINRSRLIDEKNISEIKENYNEDDYFTTIIPVSADFRVIEERQHTSIYKYKPNSKGATAFRSLAKEVIHEFFQEEEKHI